MRTATFKQSKIKPMRRGIGSKSKNKAKQNQSNSEALFNSEARKTDGI